ncbi:hypothetical protein [Floridanema aerugineum]|uniref:Uncharacterized protein n=1 Tax=Floridaenema aerugineum BLCC-F46 TaxID=3153654 RepID=A0ABV4X9Q0_9CYAN
MKLKQIREKILYWLLPIIKDKLKYISLSITICTLIAITSCDSLVYQNCIYEGQRLNGLPHGQGKIWCPVNGTIYSNSHPTYKGEWKEGKCHGEGVISVRDNLDDKKYSLFRVRCENDKCWSIEEDFYAVELSCKG